MRMWMVNPEWMCRKHLLGEHVECHMFLGHFKKKKGVSGYIQNNCLEPQSLIKRHNDLVAEMERRGYNHKTPLVCQNEMFYISREHFFHIIDRESSLNDLMSRCPHCRGRKHNANVV